MAIWHLKQFYVLSHVFFKALRQKSTSLFAYFVFSLFKIIFAFFLLKIPLFSKICNLYLNIFSI